MKQKIRINVLARELEVKSHLILELLPDLGVSEKLTHSSSIDEDVADKLRVKFGLAPSGNGTGTADHELETEDREGEAAQFEEASNPAAEPERREPPKPVEQPAQSAHPEAATEPVAAEPAPPLRPAPPIRPPISAP